MSGWKTATIGSRYAVCARLPQEQCVEGEPETPATPPDETAEPSIEPTTERLGRREMMMIAGAMIGSGALMIGVLSARSSETTAGNGPPITAAASPAASAPVLPTRGWIENSTTWTASARRSVAFELAARNETQVWMRTVRPALVVRCVDGRIDTFVFTDSPAAMEAKDEDHTVRISLDGQDARTERWPDSSAHDALFAPDGAGFAARLAEATTFRFGYTPHNAAPVAANFDVAGLGGKIASSKACGRR